MGKHLKHPFGQSVLVLFIAYLLLDFGIQYIPPLIGIVSAPIPNSVLLQYLITVGVGILLWVSDNDARWAEFKEPMHVVMVDPDRKMARASLMVLVPILIALFWKGRKVPLAAVLSSVFGLASMIVYYVVVAQLGVENETYGTYIWSVSIGDMSFELWQEYALFFTLPASFLGFVIGTLLGRRPTDHREDSE